MRYSVVRHLDKVELYVCGGRAFRVRRRLLTCLKSADWCRFKGHHFDPKDGYPIDAFLCPGAEEFRVTSYRKVLFSVQCSDPTVDVQRKLLNALEVARAAYSDVSCQFACV